MGDLELSVSPIGKPPTLDIMDVTVMSTDDQNLSFYGPEHVDKQPKVSTLKLPNLVKRRGSSAPVKTTNEVLCYSSHALACLM